MKSAKLTSIYRTDNTCDEYEIEFNFTWDRHFIITIDRGMTAEEIGALLIKSGRELTRLADLEDWNKLD